MASQEEPQGAPATGPSDSKTASLEPLSLGFWACRVQGYIGFPHPSASRRKGLENPCTLNEKSKHLTRPDRTHHCRVCRTCTLKMDRPSACWLIETSEIAVEHTHRLHYSSCLWSIFRILYKVSPKRNYYGAYGYVKRYHR